MNLNGASSQALEKWSSLTAAKKSAAAVIGVAVVLALIFLFRGVGQTQYTPLFTQLNPQDASAVVEKLKEAGVNYQLADQGGTILVPEPRVYELRLQMASEGILPTEGVGFELFDQNKLGMTDFERQLNFQRALQEELRRTITAMEEVEQARVHLVLPEQSVFVEDQENASASVVIKLQPLAKMTPGQIKGIVMLVAYSVENLKPEDVHVIDMTGRILSDEIALGDDQSSVPGRMEQQELKRQFEDDLEDRVEKMLERIFGPGKAVAMISADLDFDQRQVTRISYGDDGTVRNEHLVDEETTSTNTSAGGVPGSDSNVSTYPAIENNQSNTTESIKSDVTRQYEIDQEQETVVNAPGALQRLSTAVTVDGPLTAQQEAQIKELVTTAIGYYPDRGDQITVTSMAFDNSLAEAAQQEMAEQAAKEAQQNQIKQYTTIGLAALALILAFIIIIVILRRRRAGDELDATIEEIVPIQDLSTDRVEQQQTEGKDQKQKLRRIVEEKPDEAVDLVKAWLEDN
ncbi:flagellar M-ring protein FliF [Metallumcola ferriviriculae]|uniref:Flagellar M-ring protein n=1 Tax=Metallumcola ferriviriculae TaxID=3039180 RepID=A0AAU0UQM7_9FIRM|nr:flagellar M-ring protein FliF [Desulfitibacteraceae bacterium MK1]